MTFLSPNKQHHATEKDILPTKSNNSSSNTELSSIYTPLSTMLEVLLDLVAPFTRGGSRNAEWSCSASRINWRKRPRSIVGWYDAPSDCSSESTTQITTFHFNTMPSTTITFNLFYNFWSYLGLGRPRKVKTFGIVQRLYALAVTQTLRQKTEV